MAKKKQVQEVEEIDESYHSESDGGDQGEFQEEDGLREIDATGMGNFASDDSDEEDMQADDSDELGADLKRQKTEAMALNQTWGRKKQGFYGRDKSDDEDSDTDDDQDELEQAERLQAIKAQKMKRFMQHEQEKVIKSKNDMLAADKEKSDEESAQESDSDSSDDDRKNRGRIGDRLFQDSGPSQASLDLKEEFKKGTMDPETMRGLIEKESPELIPMLQELHQAQLVLSSQIEPALKLIKPLRSEQRNNFIKSRQGQSYLEMKQNLLYSYQTFLTFYLLMKLEGNKSVKNHPVAYKLANIKGLLEKLSHLDDKLQGQITKIVQKAESKEEEVVEEDLNDSQQQSDENDDDMVAADGDPSGDDDEYQSYGSQDPDADLTPAQLAELQKVIMMNQKQMQAQGTPQELTDLSKSEIKKEKKKKARDFKSKIEKLDDDFVDIQTAITAKVQENQSKLDAKKELHREMSQQKKQVPQKKAVGGEQQGRGSQKVKFDQLNLKNQSAGDDENLVYKEQQDKLRDRKSKRKEKEKLYKQAKDEEIENLDQSIQRNVQRDIIKNKGLTRRRKKTDRNPRVKKRMQYEKMQKKRRTVVKEYKEGKEKAYKGEQSGIKTGLDRGIKM